MANDNVIPFPASGGQLTPSELADLRSLASYETYARPTRRQDLLRRRARPATYVVRVDLLDTKPPIWRRLAIDNDLPLDVLHDVLQAAMGWTDSHLHKFVMGPGARERRMAGFLTDWDEMEGEEDGLPEREVRLDEVLKKPGDRLYYDYDFGDGWEHVIKLEEITRFDESRPAADLLTGRRTCPPEDIGGPFSYQELVDWLAAPNADALADNEMLMLHVEDLPDDFNPAAFNLPDHREAVHLAADYLE